MGSIEEQVRVQREQSLWKRLTDHVAKHPIRLMLTLVIPLLISSVLAVYAIYSTVESQSQRDAAICAQVNELKQDIYVAIVDISYMLLTPQDAGQIQDVFGSRFLPIKDCDP